MAESTDTAGHRLLAVEDDADASDLIVRTAKRCGYATRAAPDADSLRETIQEFQPHVITLDLCLPNIDGMEVITLIKESAFAGELIIISGQDEWIRDFTRKVAVECGLSVPAHMAKPIDLTRLRELLTGLRATGRL
jgi:two-component system chemotaxis response regulator CheY